MKILVFAEADDAALFSSYIYQQIWNFATRFWFLGSIKVFKIFCVNEKFEI